MTTLDDLTHYGIVNQIPILQAEGIDFLETLLRSSSIHSFLEIGTAIGKTSLLAAGLHPDMQVVTIERDPKMIEQAKKNFAASPDGCRITLIEGDALEAEIPPGPYDCIFIDAAKSQYTNFFNRYSPFLSEDGIIVTDNMDFHGLVAHPERTRSRNTKALIRKLKEYRLFLEQLEDYETEFLEIGDGIALTRRKNSCY